MHPLFDIYCQLRANDQTNKPLLWCQIRVNCHFEHVKFNFMLILLFIFACTFMTQCRITVKDTGVATLTRGDVGMIFYVTLCNVGCYKYHVNVRMLKCCETFSDNDMDCQLMSLMGGDMGLLHPNVTKNISLLYPNMYLHNRKGQCMISIKYTTITNKITSCELKQKIKFDTMIVATRIRPILSGYYTEYEYTQCQSVDQDPLDKCEPVNCHLKYLGYRNYYNRKWKRCQKVPLCISDPEKDLPDVSYLPISNRCRDLERLINLVDLKYLEQGLVEKSWENQAAPELSSNLRCHHGVLSNETGFCVCDDGWMSAPLDKDQYEPSLSIYHMCNIEIATWNGINSTKIQMTLLVVAVFGALFAALTIMLSIVCHMLYKCIKTRTSKTSLLHDRQKMTKCTDSLSSTEQSLTDEIGEGSVKVAAKRNSLMYHRKSMDQHVSQPSFRILEEIGRSSVSDETESEDDTCKKTEAFQPGRPSEMDID